jgi:fatty acid desaturase
MSPDAVDPILRARRAVGDLFTPDPRIYWADLLASLVVGYAAAAVHLVAPVGSAVQLAAWLLSGCALFRSSVFMHEIVHFRRGEMTGFTVAWNLLFGIPFLMPSFLYEHHLAHHNVRHYGTPRDAEYLPLAGGSLLGVAAFLAEIFLLPLLALVRFLVVAPVSFLHPGLRRFALERCSPLVINPWHRRSIPEDAPRRLWAAVELACMAQAVLFCALPFIASVHVGSWSVALGWPALVKIYLLAVLALGLNHVRTLAAHRYRGTGDAMSMAEQLADSVNVEGRTPLVTLFFPVGLGYHALHHLFPSIPYHNLGRAHRRIMAELPDWRAYRDATCRSFSAVLAELLGDVRRSTAAPRPPADRWYARLGR